MFKQHSKKSAPLLPPPSDPLALRTEHFNLYFYAAVLRVIEQTALALNSFETVFEQFPFLAGYNNELAQRGLAGWRADEAAERWRAALQEREASVTEHLPLRALRTAAALSYDELTLWLCCGLPEEDARFGTLFATLQGTPGQPRATLGLLNSWWDGKRAEPRATLQRLLAAGLLQIPNPTAPRSEWQAQMPIALWDAARAPTAEAMPTWARYHPAPQLMVLDDLILPDELRAQVTQLPALLAADETPAVIVRGPLHNGRRTLIGALAHALHRGLLEVGEGPLPEDERRLLGPLATLLNAAPLFVCDPAPGETTTLPVLQSYAGPRFIVLNQQGGVQGAAVAQAVTLTLEMPGPALRRAHWRAALGDAVLDDELAVLAQQYRLTGGVIRRTAQLARTQAKLAARPQVNTADLQQANRALNRQTLDTLATRLSVIGDWQQLAVGVVTLAELFQLETRCRRREELHRAVGPALRVQLNAGVGALLSGPSGTGKTLAARVLAAALHKDLYRVDLSAVVNKYIGETEKNLSQLFARAEELDVILLLDEGDALLTQRTNVQTANDRYANLETNYLLQRLESFEGILLVTTNAGDRIDSAFQRRMDVVIDFRPPEAMERWAIWQMHLPEAHAVDELLLQEVAGRCAFTGGQIRNAVLHASLLALEDGGVLQGLHLEAAVQREYRKLGAVCPLRRAAGMYR